MSIVFRFIEGHRGGRIFDFIPADHAFAGSHGFDRNVPGAFSVTEDAFLFVEGAIATAFPEWLNGYHWGVAWLPRETWLRTLTHIARMRADIETGIHPKALLEKHLVYPQLLTERYRLHRRMLLGFLDGFELRACSLLDRHGWLVIGGI